MYAQVLQDLGNFNYNIGISLDWHLYLSFQLFAGYFTISSNYWRVFKHELMIAFIEWNKLGRTCRLFSEQLMHNILWLFQVKIKPIFCWYDK